MSTNGADRRSSLSLSLIRSGLRSDIASGFEHAIRRRKLIQVSGSLRTPADWQRWREGVAAEGAQTLNVVYRCWPGSGKTTTVGVIASEVAAECKTLVFGLAHRGFSEYERISQPRRVTWTHWKGHNKECPADILAGKGYVTGPEDCTCDARASRGGNPAFAPIEYALSDRDPDTLNVGDPLAREALSYDLWVFDEIDFSRFVSRTVVTKRDLELAAEHHPSGSVRGLSEVLIEVLEEHTAANRAVKRYAAMQHWSGTDFHNRFLERYSDSQLERCLWNLKNLERQTVWYDDAGSPKDQPCDFAPALGAVLSQEYHDLKAGAVFHPQIHVVWDKPGEGEHIQSVLRLVRRKFVSPLAPPILILDATADIHLLKVAFDGIDDEPPVPTPDFPCKVRVWQHVGDRVTKGTLDISDAKAKLPPKYRRLLIRELQALGTNTESDTPKKVGVVTFKQAVEDCQKAVIEAGFNKDQIVTGWYYNQRGDNSFSDCDVLVLIGFPAPNSQALFEEASALFVDSDMPIHREPKRIQRDLMLRNGHNLTVPELFDHQDTRLSALYWQKSHWELYQAFHRSRAYVRDKPIDVLVLTDVPIEGVKVDGFLGKEGAVFDALEWLLGQQEQVTIPQLVDRVFESGGLEGTEAERGNLRKWIVRPETKNYEWLAQATGTGYVPGTSKKLPGAFHALKGGTSPR